MKAKGQVLPGFYFAIQNLISKFVKINAMKKLLFIVVMFIAASSFAQSAADVDKVKTLMKAEPKVKDFVLTSANVLYVSVIDNGTNRDGYAEYMCQVMRDEHVNVLKVKVVKLGSQKDPKRDNAYGVKLGEAQCK